MCRRQRANGHMSAEPPQRLLRAQWPSYLTPPLLGGLLGDIALIPVTVLVLLPALIEVLSVARQSRAARRRALGDADHAGCSAARRCHSELVDQPGAEGQLILYLRIVHRADPSSAGLGARRCLGQPPLVIWL